MFDAIQSLPKEGISRAEFSLDNQSKKLSDKSETSFTNVLDAAISNARTDENSAADMAEKFASGDPSVGMHETIIAAEKASISVRYAVTLKNKILESYKELMNTPL